MDLAGRTAAAFGVRRPTSPFRRRRRTEAGANVAPRHRSPPSRACRQARCVWQQAYLNCHCHALSTATRGWPLPTGGVSPPRSTALYRGAVPCSPRVFWGSVTRIAVWRRGPRITADPGGPRRSPTTPDCEHELSPDRLALRGPSIKTRVWIFRRLRLVDPHVSKNAKPRQH